MKTRLLRYLGLAIGVFGTACGVHQAATPTLSGPSTLATNITISATPDSLTQNGFSQAAVKVSVFGPNGQPVSGQPLRLYTAVGGTVVDYGALNTKSIVTGNDGTATAVYTAPLPAPPPNDSTMTAVSIVATLVSSDAQTTQPVQTSITLVPAGVILPPASAPVAAFGVTTGSPVTNSPTLFDGTGSCGGPLVNNACPSTVDPITTYSWSFGDGGTGTGPTPSHTYLLPNAYNVTLMVTTSRGAMSAPTTKSVVIAQSVGPTAAFVFSPSQPTVGLAIVFNAVQSTAGLGHNIVSYSWNFGDGGSSSGSPTTHAFTVAGSYNVTLTVTDEVGQKGTGTQLVPVTAPAGGLAGAPSANFTSSPALPFVGQDVVFDSSSSAASPGRTLVDYAWNFGDATPIIHGTQRIIDHTYSVPGTFVVNLVLTDDQGSTGQKSANVVVASGAPTANLSVFKTGGNAVQADGSASTSTGTSTISTYTFFWGDGGSTSGASSAAPHTYLSAGTYTVTLRVTDSEGRVGTSPAQTVTVP